MLFMLLSIGLYGILVPTDLFPAWLDQLFKDYLWMDKVMHAGLFFSVVVMLHWSTHIRRRNLMMMAIAVGLGTELMQMGIEGRSGSVGDFLADTGGAMTGLWLSGVLSVFITTKTRDIYRECAHEPVDVATQEIRG